MGVGTSSSTAGMREGERSAREEKSSFRETGIVEKWALMQSLILHECSTTEWQRFICNASLSPHDVGRHRVVVSVATAISATFYFMAIPRSALVLSVVTYFAAGAGLDDAPQASGAPRQMLDGVGWTATHSTDNLEIAAIVPGDLVTDLQRAGIMVRCPERCV